MEPQRVTEERLNQIEAQRARAVEEITRLCKQPQSWRMCIPVQENDSDMIFIELTQMVTEMIAEIRRLQAENEALLTKLTNWQMQIEEIERRLRAQVESGRW